MAGHDDGLAAGRVDLSAAAGLAVDIGHRAPLPGAGRTGELWDLLMALGSRDLTVARVVEPHLDALAILDQAGMTPLGDVAGGLLGVYAAEGRGLRLTAEPRSRGGTGPRSAYWELSGGKPWCSLADRVERFLVTAWVDEGRRSLFLVDRATPGITAGEESWVARGLAQVESPTLHFRGVSAVEVGGPEWYLERPGFAWGGIGVAAVWLGGALGVARRVLHQGRLRPADQIAQMHLGALDATLHAARTVLHEAARSVDAGKATGREGALLAARVRQVVRRACEEVLTRADHALGPAPLTAEEEHARRVHDLHLYIRQEHAERDQAALGALILDHDADPW